MYHTEKLHQLERAGRSASARRSWVAAVVAAALLLGATGARAQVTESAASSRFDVRPYVGAFIPTGDQRDVLKDAVLVGAQLSYSFLNNFAVVGNFGWVPSKDKLSTGEPTIDLFQYDAGLEARFAHAAAGSWTIDPFVGAGIGGRTYGYRDDIGFDDQTVFDGYGALGVQVNRPRVGVRVEARDYISDFKGLAGDASTGTRNDIGIAAALAIRF
jgi:hypothetical protein